MTVIYYIAIVALLLGLTFLLLSRKKTIGKIVFGIGIAILIFFELQSDFKDYVVAYNAYLFYLPDIHAYHWWKKFLQMFFEPMPIVIYLLVISYIFVLFKKKNVIPQITLSLGVVLLILFGYNWFGTLFAYPLTNAYSPCKNIKIPVKYIAVLCGPADKYCFPEGIKLCKKNENSKLIVSVYDKNGKLTSSLAEKAKKAGIVSKNIIYNLGPTDTYKETYGVSRIVKQEPFALVADSLQMKRAMILLKYFGANPIPVPVNFITVCNEKGPRGFPSVCNFNIIQAASHEYLSILWIYLERAFGYV